MASFVTQAQRDSLVELYVGYFNRAPEAAGLNYWSKELLTGINAGKTEAATLTGIANQFYAAGVQYNIFGAGQTVESFISTAYKNALGRDTVDTAGLAYWKAKLVDGSVSRGEFVQKLISDAKAFKGDATWGWVATYMENRVAVANKFADGSDNITGQAAITAGTSALSVVTPALAQAGQTVAQALAAADAAGVGGAGSIFTLTTGIDTGAPFTGTAGNDTFNALDGLAAAKTFTTLDSIDGGAGTDTLNIVQSAAFSAVAATVKNIETANITSAADVVVDTTAWTGLTKLNVVAAVAAATSVAAAATTDVVATVGALAATTATFNGGKGVAVTATGLTNLAAATNAISVGQTTAAAGAVTVNATGSLAADAETLGAITVVGGTSIAVTETLTATAALALATKTSNTVVNITGGNVVATGNASTTSVSVTQNAAVAAVQSATAGVVGIVNGTVTITDGNLATASDTITTVTLNNYGASTVASNVLSTVNVSGGATAATASGTLALNTTATDTSTVATTLALNSAGGFVGVISGSQAAKYTTVNVASTAATTIADVSFAAATALNISGAGVTTLTGFTAANNTKLASIVSSGAGVTIGTELAVGVAVTGGAGVENIMVGATTKAINLGAGNDIVTISTTTLGAGGSINGGDGNDTLVVNTNGSAIVGLPAFVGFETLRVAGAAAEGAHNAVGFTALELGATAAASSFVNVAAGVGLTVLAAATGGHTITLANATGTADVFGLTLSSAANLVAGSITLAGVETVNITNTDTLTTTASGINTNTLTLVADAAKSIVVTGNAGLDFTGSAYAKVTNFDASGITGATTDAAALAVTYVSGNVTIAEAVSIKGGAGNDSLTGSASAIDTINGGAGADTLVYTGAADVFTGAAGADTFDINAVGTSTAYLTVADAVATDKLDFVGITTGTLANVTAANVALAKVTLGGAATMTQYLDAAAAGNGGTNALFAWFQFGGDTYAVVDNSAGAPFVSGTDLVVKLTGVVNLGAGSITSEVLTLA